MLSRLLYLERGQLRRLAPFFGLYLLLFVALTLADGLSLTLLIKQAGPEQLPRIQGLAAVATLAATFWYLCRAGAAPSATVFLWILAGPLVLFGVLWVAIHGLGADSTWLGGLLIGRELAFALVLLHFGTYLQDFFTREELNRVMPIVYAGGRLGGIAGGALLEHLPSLCPVGHLMLLVSALLALGMVATWWSSRCVAQVDDPPTPPSKDHNIRIDRPHPKPATPHGNPATPPANQKNIPEEEAQAVASLAGFLRFVCTNRLMFWISATTVVYFACRTFLSYRCGLYFDGVFTTDAQMAQFLGRYTQWALAGSLIIQLFVVNRWIAFAGLRGAQLTYAGLLLAASLLSATSMTLASAVFIRLVEGELRYSLRNPVSQLIVNRFSRPLRLRARAWSLGLLIPLSTLAASAVLSTTASTEGWGVLLTGTVALGISYFVGSIALGRSLDDAPAETTAAATEAICRQGQNVSEERHAAGGVALEQAWAGPYGARHQAAPGAIG